MVAPPEVSDRRAVPGGGFGGPTLGLSQAPLGSLGPGSLGPLGSLGALSLGGAAPKLAPGGATFEMPDPKLAPVGGVGRPVMPSPLAPPAPPLSVPLEPGHDGIKSLLVPPSSHNRLELAAEEPAEVAAAVETLLRGMGVDWDSEPRKAKWTCVSSVDVTYVLFRAQLFRGPSGGLVLETRRDEGDAVAFAKVARMLTDGLAMFDSRHPGYGAYVANLRSHELLAHLKPLPASAPSPAITADSLRPLLEMAGSGGVDQQLYAAQVAARLCRSKEDAKEAVAGSELLAQLIKTADAIDMACPLPFQNAFLRHVAGMLALISEDESAHERLSEKGALLVCFRMVAGALGGSGSCNCTCVDVESRREAARALANMMTPMPMRERMKGKLTEGCSGEEIKRWTEYVASVPDQRLKEQCLRVVRYIL